MVGYINNIIKNDMLLRNVNKLQVVFIIRVYKVKNNDIINLRLYKNGKTT